MIKAIIKNKLSSFFLATPYIVAWLTLVSFPSLSKALLTPPVSSPNEIDKYLLHIE